MKNEDVEAVVKALGERYVLVPKNRLWHFAGGFAALSVAAFGLSFAGALAGLKTSSAVEAAKEIESLRIRAQEDFDALPSQKYVSYDEDIVLIWPHGDKLFSVNPPRTTGKTVGTDETLRIAPASR